MILLDAFFCNFAWWRYSRGGVWARWSSPPSFWIREPICVLNEEDFLDLVNEGHLQVEIHV